MIELVNRRIGGSMADGMESPRGVSPGSREAEVPSPADSGDDAAALVSDAEAASAKLAAPADEVPTAGKMALYETRLRQARAHEFRGDAHSAAFIDSLVEEASAKGLSKRGQGDFMAEHVDDMRHLPRPVAAFHDHEGNVQGNMTSFRLIPTAGAVWDVEENRGDPAFVAGERAPNCAIYASRQDRANGNFGLVARSGYLADATGEQGAAIGRQAMRAIQADDGAAAGGVPTTAAGNPPAMEVMNQMTTMKGSEKRFLAQDRAASEAASANAGCPMAMMHTTRTANVSTSIDLLGGIDKYEVAHNARVYGAKACRAMIEVAHAFGLDTARLGALNAEYERAVMSSAVGEEIGKEAGDSREAILEFIEASLKDDATSAGARAALETYRRALDGFDHRTTRADMNAFAVSLRGAFEGSDYPAGDAGVRVKHINNLLYNMLRTRDNTHSYWGRTAEGRWNLALNDLIGIVSKPSCKSGQDRTLYLFAVALCNRALMQNARWPYEKRVKFVEEMNKIADAADGRDMPTTRQKGASWLPFTTDHAAEFRRLAGGTDGDVDMANEMLEFYRQSYFNACMEVGIPITYYSTLVRGLKWGKNAIDNNPYPIMYLPNYIEVNEGGGGAGGGTRRIQLMQGGWSDYKNYTDVGWNILKGGSATRGA